MRYASAYGEHCATPAARSVCQVERYKYVAVVNVGRTADAELVVASRCLWNPDVDTFASCSYKQHGIFAVATVYAIYRE